MIIRPPFSLSLLSPFFSTQRDRMSKLTKLSRVLGSHISISCHDRPRLVVLGSGWAAFSLIKHIDRSIYDVTLVSPRNHMLFTPLLSSTAVGTLEFRSITEPIRNSFRDISFHQATCTQIDPTARALTIEAEGDLKSQPRISSVGYDLYVCSATRSVLRSAC
jgi:hypothetical protein